LEPGLTISAVSLHPEVGKVTLKSNGDEALSDEFILKVMVMKRLTKCFL
jgi:hypothetical protein